MATKTISLTEEAYEKLNRLKQHGESFSQVILRLTERRGAPDQVLQTIERIRSDDPQGSQELAENIEQVFGQRKDRKLRKVDL